MALAGKLIQQEAEDEHAASSLMKARYKLKEAVSQKLKELGVEETLINLKGMTQGMLVILGQKNIGPNEDCCRCWCLHELKSSLVLCHEVHAGEGVPLYSRQSHCRSQRRAIVRGKGVCIVA